MQILIVRGVVAKLLLSFLFMTLLASISGCTTSPSTLEEEARQLAMRSSVYLWKQQAADGGWHSRTHGLLKRGQALTPFVLHALLQGVGAPEVVPETKVSHAIAFIRRHLTKEGVLGLADPILLEYPNYATSYALRVLKKQGIPDDDILIQKMSNYLLAQQFDQSRSIQKAHPAFGGWGFGELNVPEGQTGYVDLSHTRRVLQALRIAHGDGLQPAYEKAQQFLATLQNRALLGTSLSSHFDGGFHYSPSIFLANKGEVVQTQAEPVFLSYATATCDGVLALLASGASKKDVAIQDAMEWLAQHSNLAIPEGIPVDRPAQWHRVMFYYHLSVRAEVYHHVGWPDTAREEMLQILKTSIREDGSFVNEAGAPNKENDPLLATALALSALKYIAAGLAPDQQ